jgi:hypothetical protein
MKDMIRVSCFTLVAGCFPLLAQAEMRPIAYPDLAQISGQALTLDIGKDKSKGLHFSMDSTGGAFSVGPAKARYRLLSYENELSGAGFDFVGGRDKSRGFNFTWTTPSMP